MIQRKLGPLLLALALSIQSASAQNPSYHLKKLEIQARAFLQSLHLEPQAPENTTSEAEPNGQTFGANASVQEQVGETATWSENLAREDLSSIITTSQELQESLSGDSSSDDFRDARNRLDSLARRLRVSSSPLELDPQQSASLELVQLELEEAQNSVDLERGNRVDSGTQFGGSGIGFGYGYGYGYGYGGYGCGGGFLGFRRGFRGGFRRGFRRGGFRRGFRRGGVRRGFRCGGFRRGGFRRGFRRGGFRRGGFRRGGFRR